VWPVVRVIARKTLIEYWRLNRKAEQPLKAWFAEAKKASWKNPHEIIDQYGSASIVGNNRAVFNIAGNTYRLVVAIHYGAGIIYIRFIGTHKEYDQIDVETV